MPLPFAKLFDFLGGYQLLVQREDPTDNGLHECSITIKDHQGITCRMAGAYKSAKKRDERFAEITVAEAEKMALGILRMLDNTFQFPAQ